MQFAVDGTNFGSPVTLSNGRPRSGLGPGRTATYTITATYSGDTIYTASNGSSSPDRGGRRGEHDDHADFVPEPGDRSGNR